MTTLLCQQAALAASQAFRDRIYVWMVASALSVQGEALGAFDPTVYGKRQSLAVGVLANPLAYLERFVVAAAGQSNIAADVSAPVLISSSTAVNPSVVTTAAAHGMATGDTVVIAGHATNTVLNNSTAGSPSAWAVTVLTTTTYSVPVSGTGAGTGGTSTRQPSDTNIANFAAFAQWSDLAGVDVRD
jgi:hypothetical protein